MRRLSVCLGISLVLGISLALGISQVPSVGRQLPLQTSSILPDVVQQINAARRPQPSDIMIDDQMKAAAILAAAETVFWRFDFGDIGQRLPGDAPPEVAELAGGMCESTVEAFRRILDGIVKVQQLDLVVPNGRPLAGHSIAYVPTDTGHILVDTTFGILFVHSGSSSPTKAFHSGAYSVFSIGEGPEDYSQAIGSPLIYYEAATASRASFALPGDPLYAKTERFAISDGIQIGAVDGDHEDVIGILGSYHGAIGNYYRKTRLRYRFSGDKGNRYAVQFFLAKAHTNSFSTDVAVLDADGDVADTSVGSLYGERSTFTVLITAPSDNFTVEFSREEMGARFVDAIIVAPLAGGLDVL